MKYVPRWDKTGGHGGYFCSTPSGDPEYHRSPCLLCKGPGWAHLLVEGIVDEQDRDATPNEDRISICKTCAQPYIQMGALGKLVHG